MRHRWLRASVLVLCFGLAVATGYRVSAQLGTDALRREAERRLSALLHGSVRIEATRVVLRGGLFVEGDRVEVYPSARPPHAPRWRAARVAAEIDVLALLFGRFRLNGLALDEAVFEIERAADGRWEPPPFQTLASRARARPAEDFEGSLDVITAVEAITRTLLERPIVARRVELRRSRLVFLDATRRLAGPSHTLALERIDGRLVHAWLSSDAELRLSAELRHAGGPAIPLRVEGHRRPGEPLRLALTLDDLPLAAIEPYLVPADGRARIAGRFGGAIVFETGSRQHGRLELRADLEDFSAAVDARSGRFAFERPLVHVETALEIHPGRVRLVDARIEAGAIAWTAAGAAERPLGPEARARLELAVGGLELAAVREIVRSLPDADAVALEDVLARVEQGRIERIDARGTARLDEWGPFLVGDADRVPHGFVLGATVSDVQVRASEQDLLSGVGGRLELTGDRLVLREVSGLWNDEPLPRLRISIDGVTRLFRGEASTLAPALRPGALPGLSPLRALLAGEAAPEEPAAAPTPLRLVLRIDRLDHPLLRWPIREARVVVDRDETGLRLAIDGGRWAGAPFESEVAVATDGADGSSVAIDVRMIDREAAAARAPTVAPEPASPPDVWALADAQTAAAEIRSGASADAWAEGRFEAEGIGSGDFALQDATGHFAFRRSTLVLDDVRAGLVPAGTLAARLELDLARPDEVGSTLQLEIAGGDVERLARWLGAGAGQASGRFQLVGRVEGPLRPQTPLLAALAGHGRIEARNGQIRRDELPLVLALAQASSGYNDFAARDAVAYDAIRAGLVLEQGRVSTQDFALDGPLRVYGSGSIDALHPPHEIVAVVGLFLFRGAGQIMESIPLVKAILPGSERGLVGAYFEVRGPVAAPKVRALAGKTVAEDLPDVIAAPVRLLRSILAGGGGDGQEAGAAGRDDAPPAARPESP